jgi:hypothetical protein
MMHIVCYLRQGPKVFETYWTMIDAVLTRKKRERPPIEPIFDGKRQAQLIALACSKRRPAALAGRSVFWPNTSSNAKSSKPPTSIRSPGR